MSALGQTLEEEGIATVSISLIREHSAALAPPRALWVPFMLGRPLGVPNDASFQTRVLLAALRLLERPTGPLLEDFAEEAPYEDLGDVPAALNCPVSFPRMRSAGALAERLDDEISQLRAWHEVASRQRGRTSLGLTGLAPAGLGEFLSAWVGAAPRATFREGLGLAAALKQASDELKAPTELQNWFWLETAAGELFLAIRDKAAQSADPSLRGLGSLSLVPRAVQAILNARGGT